MNTELKKLQQKVGLLALLLVLIAWRKQSERQGLLKERANLLIFRKINCVFLIVGFFLFTTMLIADSDSLGRFKKSYSQCSTRNENTAGREAAGCTVEDSPVGASRAGATEFNRRPTVYSETRVEEHRSDAVMRGYRIFENALKWDSESWMSLLPDDQKISQINLPGTHDSAAIANKLEACFPHGLGLYDCQDRSITRQLEGGIRLLDIRIKVKSNGKGGHYFMTCHGTIKIPYVWNAMNEYQPFDSDSAQCDVSSNFFLSSKPQQSVLEECETFLNAHPCETIVMLLKIEDSKKFQSEDFKEELSAVLKNHLSLFYEPQNEEIPTLGKLRGKIYLLIRSDPAVFPATSISWNDNTSYQPNAFHIGSCSFEVQDHYWDGPTFPAEKKATLFFNAIKNFHQLDKENHCLINFASARNALCQGVFITKNICDYLAKETRTSSQQFLSFGWNFFDKPFDSFEEAGYGKTNCVELLINSLLSSFVSESVPGSRD